MYRGELLGELADRLYIGLAVTDMGRQIGTAKDKGMLAQSSSSTEGWVDRENIRYIYCSRCGTRGGKITRVYMCTLCMSIVYFGIV